MDAEQVAFSRNSKSYLRKRLNSVKCWESGIRMRKEAEEISEKIENMVLNTMENGNGNSALVIGPRGCGKSMIVENVLHKLSEKYNQNLIIIQLNGLICSEDRAALRETSRQLCLLKNLNFSKSSTLDDNLQFLNNFLQESSKLNTSVIFVLDEFDLFAQKSKQVFLYSLLDFMQLNSSHGVFLLILAVTSRMDADQLLEKRVRSRFAHQKLLVFPPNNEEKLIIFKQNLMLPANFDSKFSVCFNEHVEKITKLTEFQKIFAKYTSIYSSIRSLNDFAFRSLCNINQNRMFFIFDDFVKSFHSLTVSSKLSIIKGLSVLELYLLTAIKRLESNESNSSKDSNEYNFCMIYNEYEKRKLTQRQNLTDDFSRQIALEAFESLIEKRLVEFCDHHHIGKDMVEFRHVRLLLFHEEIAEIINTHPSCPESLKNWFSMARA